jgi:hypothetical protein
VIGPTQKPVPDNTRHSQQTGIRAQGGIRTRSLGKRPENYFMPVHSTLLERFERNFVQSGEQWQQGTANSISVLFYTPTDSMHQWILNAGGCGQHRVLLPY